MTDDDLRGLRLGDADRNAALDVLTSHFVEGRLSQSEFDERSSAVMTSLTYADLEPLFADLPGGVPLIRGAAGCLAPRTQVGALLVDFDEDKELRTIAQKGRVMDRVDSVAWAVAAVVFFSSLFVFHWPHAWLAWLAALGVTLVGRAVMGYNDADEETYEKIKEAAEKERTDRLAIALQRRRELEK